MHVAVVGGHITGLRRTIGAGVGSGRCGTGVVVVIVVIDGTGLGGRVDDLIPIGARAVVGNNVSTLGGHYIGDRVGVVGVEVPHDEVLAGDGGGTQLQLVAFAEVVALEVMLVFILLQEDVVILGAGDNGGDNTGAAVCMHIGGNLDGLELARTCSYQIRDCVGPVGGCTGHLPRGGSVCHLLQGDFCSLRHCASCQVGGADVVGHEFAGFGVRHTCMHGNQRVGNGATEAGVKAFRNVVTHLLVVADGIVRTALVTAPFIEIGEEAALHTIDQLLAAGGAGGCFVNDILQCVVALHIAASVSVQQHSDGIGNLLLSEGGATVQVDIEGRYPGVVEDIPIHIGFKVRVGVGRLQIGGVAVVDNADGVARLLAGEPLAHADAAVGRHGSCQVDDIALLVVHVSIGGTRRAGQEHVGLRPAVGNVHIHFVARGVGGSIRIDCPPFGR